MADISKEKSKVIGEINAIGIAFQKIIKAQYAENEDFIHAADEKDNDQNNKLLLKVFEFFGMTLIQLTRDYSSKVETKKSIDELRLELQENLLAITKAYEVDIKNAIDKLLSSTVQCIEKSGFFTEIVTNPQYNGRQASKEMKRL